MTCQNSVWIGTGRPNIATSTDNTSLTGSTSRTTPLKLANGPSTTSTESPGSNGAAASVISTSSFMFSESPGGGPHARGQAVRTSEASTVAAAPPPSKLRPPKHQEALDQAANSEHCSR